MLLEKIKQDLEKAVKRQDPLELKTLRFILSQIHYQEIEKQDKLTDDEVLGVLLKEVKKRQEAIEMMKKGNRQELVEEENKKLVFINKYLPEQLSDEEIKKVIEETIASLDNPQMGTVIGMVMKKIKGKASGARVAGLVGKKLVRENLER